MVGCGGLVGCGGSITFMDTINTFAFIEEERYPVYVMACVEIDAWDMLRHGICVEKDT